MKKLIGWWRLLFGLCPRCNSDAPETYTCPVCKSYRGLPSKQLKEIWWKRFKNEIKEDYHIH